jgi:hypothetical protein
MTYVPMTGGSLRILALYGPLCQCYNVSKRTEEHQTELEKRRGRDDGSAFATFRQR